MKNELNSQIINNKKSQWLVILHGVSEHSRRYSQLIQILSEKYNICTYDLRGHGESPGKRGYIESFDEYILDHRQILDLLREKYKMKKYSYFAHSLGALILSSYIQDASTEEKDDIDKVFLSAPPVLPGGPHIKRLVPKKLLKRLSKSFLLSMSLPIKTNLILRTLSSDPQNYKNILKDTNYNKQIHLKLGIEIYLQARKTFSKKVNYPKNTFCIIPQKDTVTSAHASREYFQNFESHVEVKMVKGARHELLNERDEYKDIFISYLKDSLIN